MEAVYKGLLAQSNQAKSELKIAKWHMRKAQLVAPFDAMLISTTLVPGMVITEENAHESVVRIAKRGTGGAVANLSRDQVIAINASASIRVSVSGQTYKGKVHSIEQQGESEQYQVKVLFNGVKGNYWPGQSITVSY